MKPKPEHDSRFQQLRALWPRKNVGMYYAEQKFIALKASNSLFAEMMNAMHWQAPLFARRAHLRGMEMVPHLSKWINQRMWEDGEVDGYGQPPPKQASEPVCRCGIVKSYHEAAAKANGCREFQARAE